MEYVLQGQDSDGTWYTLSDGSFEEMLKEQKINKYYFNADECNNRGYDLRHHGYVSFRVVPDLPKAEPTRYQVTQTFGYVVYSDDPDFVRKIREDGGQEDDLLHGADQVYYEGIVDVLAP